MKRPAVWYGLAVILGEVLGQSFGWIPIGACAVYLGICVMTGIRYRHFLTRLCLCFVPVFLLAGFVRGRQCEQTERQVNACISAFPGTVTGRVLSVEDETDYMRCILRTKDYMANAVDVVCMVERDFDSCTMLAGDEVCIKGTPESIDGATNPGCFDAKAYYGQKGIYVQIRRGKVQTVLRKHSRLTAVLDALKSRMSQVIRESLEEDAAGIMAAIILGDKSDVPEDIYNLYQRQGIGHVLAISALHLSIVGMGLYNLFRKLSLPILIRQVVSSAVMVLYLMMCGFSVSALRAMIMFLSLMIGQMLGKKRDELSALFTALIILVLRQPGCIRSYSFLMSFGCILSLLWMKLMKGKVAGMYITMLTAPMTAWFQFELSMYSVCLNMFVVPAMSFLYPLGLIGSLAGCVWQMPGKWLLKSAGALLKVFEAICEAAEALPFAHMVTGRPAVWKLILIYAVLLIFTFVTHKRVRHAKWFRYMFLVYLVLFIQFKPDNTQVIFLDVGQGDCSLIRTDAGGAYLIDGGSSSKNDVGSQVIDRVLRYYGITSLDGVIMTHMDEDHVNGIQWLLEHHYEIRCLYMSGSIQNQTMKQLFTDLAGERHIPVYQIFRGAVINSGGMSLECLHPSDDFETDSDNAGSLVLYMRCQNRTFLFTGDVESSGESELVNNLSLSGAVDVLKVAHHGSKYSTSQDFLDFAKPKYAVISCGKNNCYGHPAAETLERLEQAGTTVDRTDRCGAVLCIISHGKIKVHRWCN